MTPNTFHSQIRTAIADEKLQSALDKNAEMRLVARATAFADLKEDLQNLRQRAHQVRVEVIDNHEYYLQEFMAKAQKSGFIIHRAANAAEAQKIVLEIAKKHDAKLVAKSKTMVSEEIELNHALESVGIRPVETDLGEYIVQLRKEPPSHIITPAVHLRREDVGETFHEKLGIPLTDDIQTMTDAARIALRKTFLEADIGVSGVNFGVAESGAITLVTNEGNGRMVTTVPKVHIALMGIERMVPTYDDLALMIKLLPLAATGQKISVYTQILQGPRRQDEIDGAAERHIVLIDNGRSDIRGTPLNDTLLCIRCGACLNACPVFREIGGHAYVGTNQKQTTYPGPIGSALSPALFSQGNFGHLAQASTLCGACKEVCPVDIDLPTMLLRVRGGGKELNQAITGTRRPQGIPQSVNWGLRIFTWFASGPRRFAVAQKFAAAFSRIWSPSAEWMKLPAFTGWGYSKDFPRPAIKTFRDRWLESDPIQSTLVSEDKSSENQKAVESNVSKGQSPKSPDQLITQFQTELETLGGVFIRCEEAKLVKQILTLLDEKSIDTVMAWEDAHLPTGLAASLREKGIAIHNDAQPQIRAGITGATAGIAETGSIVVTSGSGKPQSTSLLPQIHLAILREADLQKDLAEVFKLHKVREAATVSLISGPSKTADIEMTLTVGVHGPGEVYVFFI